MEILQSFGACLGQDVNRQKSRVYFSKNTPQSVKHSLGTQMGISATDDLGPYLGVPFISGRKGRDNYAFVVDKIKKTLAGWKAASLS